MSHRRRLGWVTQTLFILLISQIIRIDLDVVHTRFVFIGGFSLSLSVMPSSSQRCPVAWFTEAWSHLTRSSFFFHFWGDKYNRKELHRKTHNRRKERRSKRQKKSKIHYQQCDMLSLQRSNQTSASAGRFPFWFVKSKKKKHNKNNKSICTV